MADGMHDSGQAGTGLTSEEQEIVNRECVRQTSRSRRGLILASLGAALLGGGLVEATVLQCTTLSITIVLGMMAAGMGLLLGGGLLTGLALFASRRLGNSPAAQEARRKVTRAYVVIILLVAGVLALAYSITLTTAPEGQAGSAASGMAQGMTSGQ